MRDSSIETSIPTEISLHVHPTPLEYLIEEEEKRRRKL
jgi:hypothetical protein